MPIEGSFSCDSLAAQSKEKGLFVSEANRSGSIPAQGSIFLSRRTKTDWTHNGLFSSLSDEAFKTIEGNTNDA